MGASETPGGGGGEKLRLKIVAGNAAGDTVEVEDEFQIGRQSEGAGSLASDIEISRRHAVIRAAADGRFVIEDLGSTNGTYVNGRRVEAPLALEVGDRIEVGASALVVQVGAIQPTPASSETIAPTSTSAQPGAAAEPVAEPQVEPETAGVPDAIPAAEAEPSEPEPAAPEPAEPEPAAPEPAEPESAEPVTTSGASPPPELPPFSLRIDVDPVAGTATVALDEDADAVELVLSDGRWQLKERG
jgi:pSer/pThr/pTyr-binding forkhead associated (FHA) protein